MLSCAPHITSVGTDMSFSRSVLSCASRAFVAPIQVPSFTEAVSGR